MEDFNLLVFLINHIYSANKEKETTNAENSKSCHQIPGIWIRRYSVKLLRNFLASRTTLSAVSLSNVVLTL